MKSETPFRAFAEKMDAHMKKMLESTSQLYTVNADRDLLWKIYLESFPEDSNPMYRERTEHDCSACRHFVKSFGAVVTLKNGTMTSIWDFDAPGRYGPVANALSGYIKSCSISDAFITDQAKFGVSSNHEMLESGSVTTWEHMHAELPTSLLNRSRKTNDTIRGDLRSLKEVFKRSLEEITDDAVLTVLELIIQNSLYKGEEWKNPLTAFLDYKRTYQNTVNKDLYAWEYSKIAGPVIGKIKNHSIGVLLMDISSGMELDEAVRRYEKIVAPSNYKRPKAIFTKKMLDDAEKTITELGYLDSLGRRYAILDDITVNNILFADRDVTRKLKGGSVFSEMASEVITNPKKFDRVEEVPIDKFISEILPATQSVQVLLENRHQSNMVSLIAPKNSNSTTMFKWSNGFSWAYAGNITDSMKMRVKALGGDISGVLRFSIQWGPGNENDFDAHCIEPNKNEIYFMNKGRRHPSSGMLDVDIIQPSRQTSDGIAVENITYDNLRLMPEGKYKFFVHNYSHNGGRSGFTAEIELDGQIYSFEYAKELRQNERIVVAEVDYTRSSGFKITEKIPFSMASRKIWNLDTNQFHPVQVLMMSPNYWDGQDSIGNRHYFFMLKGCQNPEQPNGFFNEYLKADLLEHKRVFEALGSKMRVEPSENQLSGVGFSSTQRNSVIVKVTGHIDRILKVVF